MEPLLWLNGWAAISSISQAMIHCSVSCFGRRSSLYLHKLLNGWPSRNGFSGQPSLPLRDRSLHEIHLHLGDSFQPLIQESWQSSLPEDFHRSFCSWKQKWTYSHDSINTSICRTHHWYWITRWHLFCWTHHGWKIYNHKNPRHTTGKFFLCIHRWVPQSFPWIWWSKCMKLLRILYFWRSVLELPMAPNVEDNIRSKFVCSIQEPHLHPIRI